MTKLYIIYPLLILNSTKNELNKHLKLYITFTYIETEFIKGLGLYEFLKLCLENI